MTVPNSLDLDQARYFVGPDLVPTCLQMWLINRCTVTTSGKNVMSMMTLELLE